MSDKMDFEAALTAMQSSLIEPAATLYGVQTFFGDKVREQTKSAYGRLIDAHLLITGVLGAALMRVHGKIALATPVSSECNALRAAFVIGMKLCETAIEEGRYLQAHALIRQEMEIIAQLKAVRAGKRKEHNSPNVGVLEKSIRRLYGPLSAAAHVSEQWIVDAATNWEMKGDLPGPTEATRQFPDFDPVVARRSFTLHLQLMTGIIEDLSIDLSERHPGEVFGDTDVAALGMAVKLMVEEGMLTLPDPPKTD